MLDLKISLFENKLGFIFKNFSFDLLLQSTFRTFINSQQNSTVPSKFPKNPRRNTSIIQTFRNSSTCFWSAWTKALCNSKILPRLGKQRAKT